jgi:hypothetical protein
MALNGKENNMVRGPLNSRVKKIDFEIVFSELLSQKYQEFVSNPWFGDQDILSKKSFQTQKVSTTSLDLARGEGILRLDFRH